MYCSLLLFRGGREQHGPPGFFHHLIQIFWVNWSLRIWIHQIFSRRVRRWQWQKVTWEVGLGCAEVELVRRATYPPPTYSGWLRGARVPRYLPGHCYLDIGSHRQPTVVDLEVPWYLSILILGCWGTLVSRGTKWKADHLYLPTNKKVDLKWAGGLSLHL